MNDIFKYMWNPIISPETKSRMEVLKTNLSYTVNFLKHIGIDVISIGCGIRAYAIGAPIINPHDVAYFITTKNTKNSTLPSTIQIPDTPESIKLLYKFI